VKRGSSAAFQEYIIKSKATVKASVAASYGEIGRSVEVTRAEASNAIPIQEAW